MSRFSTRTGTLQWIDRRVGACVCLLLTAWRRWSGLFGRRAPAGPWKSVLIIKLAEQGSTVLAHGALRMAVERVGRENTYLLVFEENRFVVDLLGLIPPSNVLTVRTGSAWAMATSCLARLREIRRRRIDACVDMEFFARSSAAIAFFSGAARRVGFHAYYGEGPYRGDLFTHRLLYDPHQHTSRTFASLVLALDQEPGGLPALPWTAPVCPLPPLFRPESGERDQVRGLLADSGLSEGSRIVLLNANASDLLPLRKWAGSNYVLLARRLLEADPRLAIVFTGAPEEAGAVAPLVREVGSPRASSLAGRTSLRQLMALYSLSDILVTNDSGPAHFASLTEVDVVALFGPETPLLFAAPGPRSHPLWAGLACSPCVNAYNNRQTACSNNLCMQAITVEQVFGKVMEIYRSRVAAPESVR